MTDCGHLALIASGEGRGLCVLCQQAEIERLRELLKMSSDAGFDMAKDVAMKKEAEIERLRAALKANNHHLAKLVNGTDDDDPATWEDAKNQVIATRDVLLDIKP